MSTLEDTHELPQSPVTILLIDDDVKYCRLISKYLEEHEFTVRMVHDGKEGLKTATARKFDAILLDLMLPGIDGNSLLKSIRQHCNVPILMLTARGSETDRIVGLELGADDYLPKSFSAREILARLRAVLRRSCAMESTAPRDAIIIGSLCIEPSTRQVTFRGATVRLTAVEFDVLLSLARAKGRIKTREQLLNDIQTVSTDAYDRSIDVHISLLRRKFNDDARNPCLIRTIRSVGYSLVDPSDNND